jgi:hypothetical protein
VFDKFARSKGANAMDQPPPSLPERPSERFQFQIKHLLAYMLIAAIVAAGLRHVVVYWDQLWTLETQRMQNVLLGILVLGSLIYLFLRMPFVAAGFGHATRRWQDVRRHRRELAEWAKSRKGQQGIIPEDKPDA